MATIPTSRACPKGHPDGGQWTSTGQSAGFQVATTEKPPLPPGLGRLLWELAMLAIEAFRRKNIDDLAGETNDTVALTPFDGKPSWGTNSTSREYSAIDRAHARRMRNSLIRKYPDTMKVENIGQKPNDAVFHAETTVLLRAARRNGGTLQGRALEIYVDRSSCNSCETVLPKVGLELGNPTVTFINRSGQVSTMKGGKWLP
jgi:hypothetical protein